MLGTLATGVVQRRRCQIRHRSSNGDATVREINPYGVAVLRGWCYIHGWCHLRNARRTFRIDRIDRVDLLEATFRMPSDLDVVAAVERSLALSRPEYAVSLLLDGPIEEVEPWFPRFLGVCEAVGPDRTRVRLFDQQPGLLRAADQRPPVRDDGRGTDRGAGGLRPRRDPDGSHGPRRRTQDR